jgi:hypothetical protein
MKFFDQIDVFLLQTEIQTQLVNVRLKNNKHVVVVFELQGE